MGVWGYVALVALSVALFLGNREYKSRISALEYRVERLEHPAPASMPTAKTVHLSEW
jgi:hypothetical protein